MNLFGILTENTKLGVWLSIETRMNKTFEKIREIKNEVDTCQ